jgi:tetratricopeptide (TPR) repeat protein
VLQQTKDYQLRFRDGELDVATANVALLEQATAAETGNADLWQAMGLAYVYLAARATLPGGNRGDLMFALQKGMPALNRALQIDPDHAEALSVRAGMRALMGRGLNQPQLVSQALSDMNRAVELAPESVSVRLTRAFGGPGMPEDLRNRANEAADLDFLIEVSEWNRAGNFMTILRADLHLENGEVDSARELYQVIVGTGAASAAQLARSRLALLPQGKDAVMKDILALRAVAGTQCSMCHGREDVVASAR